MTDSPQRPSPASPSAALTPSVGVSPQPAGLPFSPRMGLTHVGILTAAHFFFDFVLNILPPLLPFFIRDLGLSVSLMGTVLSARSLASGVGQPLFGDLVDRRGRGWLLPALIVWTGLFTALLGFASGYWQLLGFAFLVGIGGGIFHPLATLMVQGARQERSAGVLSIFSFGGTVGMAVVPLVSIFLVNRFGLPGLGWILAPTLALAGAALAARTQRVPLGIVSVHSERQAANRSSERRVDAPAGAPADAETEVEGPARRAATDGPAQHVDGAGKRLAFLTFAQLTRAQVHVALASFLPLYYVAAGHSEAFGGAMLTVFLSVGSVSSIASAYLSDRVGRRRVAVVSQMLIVPSMLLFSHTSGWWSVLFLAASAASMFATFSTGVIYAQELMPARPGMAGSLIMGFAIGVAGIGVSAIGAIADHVGLSTTLYWVSFLPILGFPFLLRLPETASATR